MSARTWLPLLIGSVLFASCEPRTVEIQGLDELTAEIRSQRLLNRQRAASVGEAADAAPEVRGEQIQAAMAPLRDVLTQLGASQRELSARQATLTQEMRRWTQLLVQSMQADRSDEATKLSERLADLEKTIAEQDKRHRRVEDLLGSALDNTADQLEQFLKQVGAGQGAGNPRIGNPGAVDPGAARSSGAAGAEGGGQPIPAAGNDDPNAAGGAKAPPATGTPRPNGNGAGEQRGGLEAKQAGQQGSMAWLWGLAVISLVSGFVLLFSKKRTRPLAMAPEMQYAPELQPIPQTFAETNADSVDDPVLDQSVANLASGGLASGDLDISDLIGTNRTSDKPDTPQVEELWAAAALLGEAIGRLKQTGESVPPELGGHQPLPEPPDSGLDQAARHPDESLPDHTDSDEEDLDDMFVIDEEEMMDAAMFAEPGLLPPQETLDAQPLDIGGAIGTEFDAVEALGLPSPDGPANAEQATPPEQASQRSEDIMLETDEPKAAPFANEALRAPQQRPPEEPVTVIETIPQKTTLPAASGQPAARHASSSPITCRLHLSGDEQAEGRVRSLLGRDPRVLVSPAPQVRNGMGELEVSFALLPGLTAGDRSLLEQQLRDTVA
ncbi:MAG: hypothetical protein ACI89X_000328 [Planctomycetota bacterium]|jgi:hypothetical protein